MQQGRCGYGLDPIGESATGASLHRGPRLDSRMESRAMQQGRCGYGLDPIGESATGASLHRGPRLDPIGESALPECRQTSLLCSMT